MDAPTSGKTESLTDLMTAYQNLLKAAGRHETVSDTDAIWIEAFGANGGDGGQYFTPVGGFPIRLWKEAHAASPATVAMISGGDAGSGGQALTVTTISAFKQAFGTDVIVYYLGANGHHDSDYGGDGGASTVVRAGTAGRTVDLSDVLLAIGGGGGGAGRGDNDGSGGDGGDGGCALAIAAGGAAVTGKGGDGHGGQSGAGGNGQSGGAGGSSAECPGSRQPGDGAGGFGGPGGKGSQSSRQWNNGTPGDMNAIDNSLLTNGAGGASDRCGGGGGGGYGGGGGGGHRGGGGGGGSYAAAATITDAKAPTSCSTSGSADGVVRITFETHATP
jgi:hypothetical protein